MALTPTVPTRPPRPGSTPPSHAITGDSNVSVSTQPQGPPQQEDDGNSLARTTKVELLDRVQGSLRTIMETVSGSSSRLNKNSVDAISTGVHDALAMFVALSLRLCEMEAEMGRAKIMHAEMERDVLLAKSGTPHR